jgi:hypothetical protein
VLFDDPELVRELIAKRATVPIPGSIEFDEVWIDLAIDSSDRVRTSTVVL